MTPKPPRTAVWLIEFFVPPATAEPAVGDLEEEFVSRVTRSGHRAARRWSVRGPGPSWLQLWTRHLRRG